MASTVKLAGSGSGSTTGATSPTKTHQCYSACNFDPPYCLI
jgi:hypothetical protein